MGTRYFARLLRSISVLAIAVESINSTVAADFGFEATYSPI